MMTLPRHIHQSLSPVVICGPEPNCRARAEPDQNWGTRVAVRAASAFLPQSSPRAGSEIARSSGPMVRPTPCAIFRSKPMVSFLKGRRRDDDSVVAVDSGGRNVAAALEALVARAE